MSVRVALAQFSGHIDKNVNIEKAENLARQAAGNGAKVVCFPELSHDDLLLLRPRQEVVRDGRACTRSRRRSPAQGGPRDGHRDRLPALRKRQRRPLQHGRRDRPGRRTDRQVPQDVHPADPPNGEAGGDARRRAILLPARQPRFSRVRHPVRPEDRHPHLLRPPLSGGRARARHEGGAPVLVPTATYRDWIRDVWEIELAATPSPTCSTWAASTRWAGTPEAPPTASTSAPRCSSIRRAGCCAARATRRTRSSC